MFGQILTVINIAISFQLCLSADPSSPVTTPVAVLQLNYSDCSEKIHCFGLGTEVDRDDCVMKRSCITLLKIQPIETGASFTLFWVRDELATDHYVWAGLSNDKEIGDDLINEFIIKNNNTIASNQGITMYDMKKEISIMKYNIDGLADESVTYADKLLTCTWSRPFETQVQTFVFNIKQNTFYVLLAYGPINDKDQVKKPTRISVTSSAVAIDSTPQPSTLTPGTSTEITSTATSLQSSTSRSIKTNPPQTVRIEPTHSDVRQTTGSVNTMSGEQPTNSTIKPTETTNTPPSTNSDSGSKPIFLSSMSFIFVLITLFFS